MEGLGATGDTPVVLARSTGVDLSAGDGLAAALVGVDAVVDVSNVVTTRRRTAVAFFGTATAHLLAAEERAGVGHHVALSIVGCDRVPSATTSASAARRSWSSTAGCRAPCCARPQFHEFAQQVLDRPGPVALVPVMLSQPVAAREVAARLVQLCRQDPLGLAPELAGPQQLRMPDMVRRLVQARGSRRVVVPVRLPGAAGTGMADGGLLPRTDGPRGTQTFEQWLATPPSD